MEIPQARDWIWAEASAYVNFFFGCLEKKNG